MNNILRVIISFLIFIQFTSVKAGEIHNAVAAGDLNKVKMLLKTDPSLLDSRDGGGNTPLYIACIQCKVEIANFLLDSGADVNAKNNWNQNSLHAANGVCGQDIELIKRLIKKGADVNALASHGDTPLCWAAARGNLAVAQLLMDNGADPNAYDQAFGSILQNTINQGHLQMGKLLIEKGAKINLKDPSGRTELHLAAISGYAELAKILIEKNIDIHAVDRHNRTALYYAAKHGYQSVVDVLLSGGADNNSSVESNVGNAPQLTTALKEGESYYWYLGNFAGDGYSVKTKNHLLLFDPPGLNESPEAGLANGHLNPGELTGQKITMLVTKPEWERYQLDCIELAKRMQNVDLVLSYKPENKTSKYNPVPPYHLAVPHESFTIGDIKVNVIPAAQGGTAYLVEADGIKIFYAGYHASNKTSQDSSYRKEIDFLKTFGPIDVAILPVAGHLIDSHTYDSFLYLVDRLLPKAVFLMHGNYEYDEYIKFAEFMRSRSITVNYPEGIKGGDRFHYLQK